MFIKIFIIEIYYYNRYESDYDSVVEEIIEDHIIDPTEDVDEYIYIYTHLRLITELQLNIYTYIPISNSSSKWGHTFCIFCIFCI